MPHLYGLGSRSLRDELKIPRNPEHLLCRGVERPEFSFLCGTLQDTVQDCAVHDGQVCARHCPSILDSPAWHCVSTLWFLAIGSDEGPEQEEGTHQAQEIGTGHSVWHQPLSVLTLVTSIGKHGSACPSGHVPIPQICQALGPYVHPGF